MKNFLAKKISSLLFRAPKIVLFFLILLVVLSFWRVQNLKINYNQIDLIPQNLSSVKATKEMVDLVGGVGFFLLALKSDNLDHLKNVADDLAARLSAMSEIRKVTYKQDIKFIQDRIPYFVKTEDLEEAFKRVRKKIRAILRKANPFSFQLTEVKDEPLDFSDLIDKYRSINKKGIDDPYYVDPSKEMLLLVIKPKGDSNDLLFAEKLINRVDELMADYNKKNNRGAVLKEHYKGLAPGATITYGYTGGYKRNLDDSETIKSALIPTSLVAFMGIFIYLLFLLRRFSQVFLIMLTLVASVFMTFAFCELAIGELNTVTTILGAILMGFGIDFGIHFVYRLREEYTRTQDLPSSIEETLIHSGKASAISALTTAAALYILVLAEFEGFAHFGLIAGTGIIITSIMMYLTLPVAYLLLNKIIPSFKDTLIVNKKQAGMKDLIKKRYLFAKRIIIGSLILTVGLTYFATQIGFDYDARSLMTADRPSVVLQEEINERYQISSDPAGIYVKTLAEAKDLFDKFNPLPEGTTIDSVISLYTLVPDKKQQEANRKILEEIKERLDMVPPELIKEEYREKIKFLDRYLAVPPFGIEDVPAHLAQQMRPVPESSQDGYLTFFYPKISIWDGEALIKFAKEIGTVNIKSKDYHAAGMAVIFADLAEIVLRDGKKFIIFAFLIILAIILIVFRSLRTTAFAMLPLVAGMIWMLGLMDIFGWQINFMNIIIFPVVFGYGISSGVHLINRYLESKSVVLAVRRTGAAIAASSITTLIGWAALLVSNHRGLESMGILACFGILAALLVSLIVMPAFLQVAKDFRKEN